MTPTGARIDLETAKRGTAAVMAFVDGFRRDGRKLSWRRSTWRVAGLSKRKLRLALPSYIDGINKVLEGING